MELFNQYNTDGYTDEELDNLNAEWEQRVESLGLERGTDTYNQAAADFSTEVARR